VAIAQGQLPQESWFALGRLLTSTSGEPVLLSWSGSMFEYLMPLLVMPTYDNTLLDQTCKAAVARQIEYGGHRGVPWGISESGYNTVDVHLNYQYRAFGVPGLGLKRGLAQDLVIAPYASALALMVAPEQACQNLQRLAAEGFIGRYGFFEAIDYTPARQRRGQSRVLVRSFMAHHQGMSLLALAYLLLDRPMQRRFESDRLFQAVMLLLQERIPKATELFSHTANLSDVRSLSIAEEMPDSRLQQPRYADTRSAVAVERPLPRDGFSNAGAGYSRWQDIAVTRWREDATCRQLRHLLLCPRRGVRRRRLVDDPSTDIAARPITPKSIFSEARAEFQALAISQRLDDRTYGDRRSRRKMTWKCAGSTMTNRSRQRPRSRGDELCRSRTRTDRRRTLCTLRSAISSCKPRSCASTTGDSVHASAAIAGRTGAMDDASDRLARCGDHGAAPTKPIDLRFHRAHAQHSVADADRLEASGTTLVHRRVRCSIPSYRFAIDWPWIPRQRRASISQPASPTSRDRR
jgi:hypothetical protein